MFGLFSVSMIGALILASSGTNDRPKTLRCEDVSSTQSGSGTKFQGQINNSDYRFSARIPKTMAGWDGAGEGAPFHGFSIFPTGSRKACFILELHLRVLDGDKGPPVFLKGHIRGRREHETHRIGNEIFFNDVTSFSVKRGADIIDGKVYFISPERDKKRLSPAFDSFISSITFY